METMMNDVHFL